MFVNKKWSHLLGDLRKTVPTRGNSKCKALKGKKLAVFVRGTRLRDKMLIKQLKQ